jgi:putative ABC transport system permease protein
MSSVMAESMAARRFNMMLLTLFAALGLALAVVGIYGLMSYSVTQRTHEIGIRMALGADRGDVLKLVVREGMWLTLAGTLAGLAAAFGLTRLMESMLFEVRPTDLPTFGAVCLLLAVVSLAAMALPAFRAASVDPMVALRYE